MNETTSNNQSASNPVGGRDASVSPGPFQLQGIPSRAPAGTPEAFKADPGSIGAYSPSSSGTSSSEEEAERKYQSELGKARKNTRTDPTGLPMASRSSESVEGEAVVAKRINEIENKLLASLSPPTRVGAQVNGNQKTIDALSEECDSAKVEVETKVESEDLKSPTLSGELESPICVEDGMFSLAEDEEDEFHDLSSSDDDIDDKEQANDGRHNSFPTQPFEWYDESKVDGSDIVPVRASAGAVQAMVEARSALDLMLANRQRQRTSFEKQCDSTAIFAGLADCRTAAQAHSLFKSTLELATPILLASSKSPAYQDLIAGLRGDSTSEEQTAYADYLRERGVRIGAGGSRRRAINSLSSAQALKLALLSCDGHLACRENAFGDGDALKAFVRKNVRKACFADQLLVDALNNSLGEDSSLDIVSGFSVYNAHALSGSTMGETGALLADLVALCGDISITVHDGCFDGGAVWGNGLTIEGVAVVLVSDKTSVENMDEDPGKQHGLQGMRLQGTLRLECSLEALVSAFSRGAEPEMHVSMKISAPPALADKVETNTNSDSVSDAVVPNEPHRMRKDLARLAVKPGHRYPGAVQLKSWGRNESGVLGIGSSAVRSFSTPLPVPVWGPLEFTRVSKVSCGLFHGMLLSDMGLVFTWGSGSEGALGHGDTASIDLPRMVQAFSETNSDPVLCVDVAAGGDMSGSHSLAVSRKGEVFSWGLGLALGLGDTESRLVPERIDPSDFGDVLVDGVAAGGSFSLAMTCDGGVFAWGSWLHGRLGLGQIERRPEKGFLAGFRDRQRDARSKKRTAATRALLKGQDWSTAAQKYRVRPRRITGALKDREVVQIACGEAHALALDRQGRVYAWGKGSHGQLGTGSLRNALDPQLVRLTVCKSESEVLAPMPSIAQIDCGANHSLAVDSKGRLMTWGGLGAAALGLGASVTNWDVKVKGSFVVGEKPTTSSTAAAGVVNESFEQVESSSSPGFSFEELKGARPLEREQPWRWPQLVPAFTGVSSGQRVSSISAGCRHSCAVTIDGQLYVWGQTAIRGGDDCAEPRLLLDPTMRGLHAELVACGGWHTMVLSSGSAAAEGSGDLFRTLKLGDPTGGRKKFLATPVGWEDESELAVVRPDLEVIVGTQSLFAHRVIVGARCSVLRRLIALESGESPDSEAALVKVSLPELSMEAASILLEYLYSDNIFATFDPEGPVADQVIAIANEFGLQRLEALCARSQAAADSAATHEQDEANVGTGESASQVVRLLADESLLETTFAKDLMSFLNEPQWADVILTTGDNKRLYAHGIILASRSDFFKGLLAAERTERDTAHVKMSRKVKKKGPWHKAKQEDPEAPIELKVPDSQSAMLRLLAFFYSGELLDSGEGDVEQTQLLEDIQIAARYDAYAMQALAEDLIKLSEGNALRVLLLALQVGSTSLEERAMHFVVLHLPALAQSKSFLRLQQRRPDIISNILIASRNAHAFRAILSESGVGDLAGLDEDDPVLLLKRVLRTEEQAERERLEKENAQLFDVEKVNWPMLALLLLSVISYGFIITQPDLLSIVPYLNGGAILASIAVAASSVSSSQ